METIFDGGEGVGGGGGGGKRSGGQRKRRILTNLKNKMTF